MDRYHNDLYYHGGLGEANRRNYGPGDPDREDYGRAYNRPRQDNASGNRQYQHRDYDPGDRYRHHTPNRQQYEGNRGQGVSSFGGSSYAADRNQQPWERGEPQQQGYHTGRMGGYSGSAFGGANYSSHGGYGDSSRYGAMSGRGGNMGQDVSSSGYGSSNRGYRSAGHGGGHDNTPPAQHQQHNHAANYNRYDRGGYRNYDPNNRWR